MAAAVPGVGGGSAALLLGVYGRIISALCGLFSSPLALAAGRQPDAFARADFAFLGPVLLGSASAYAAAPLILRSAPGFPGPYSSALLLGIMLGGISLLFGRVRSWKKILWGGSLHHLSLLLLCAILSWRVNSMASSDAPHLLLVSEFLDSGFSGQMTAADPGHGACFFLLAGVVAAAAVIFPGFSPSHLLFITGAYPEADRAFSALLCGRLAEALAVAGPMLPGFALGLALSAGIMVFLLKRHPEMTLCMLIGLYAGSLIRLWPFRDPEEGVICGTVIRFMVERPYLPALSDKGLWVSLAIAAAGAGAILVLAARLKRKV